MLRGVPFTRAVRKFVHQDLKEWLARLLSRPDIEKEVEKSLSEKRVHSDGTWKDIWDGHQWSRTLLVEVYEGLSQADKA